MPFRPFSCNKTYPDSVNRVNPPNTTIPKTLAALPSSQYATILELVSGKPFLLEAFSAFDIVWLRELKGEALLVAEVDCAKAVASLLNRICRETMKLLVVFLACRVRVLVCCLMH